MLQHHLFKINIYRVYNKQSLAKHSAPQKQSSCSSVATNKKDEENHPFPRDEMWLTAGLTLQNWYLWCMAFFSYTYTQTYNQQGERVKQNILASKTKHEYHYLSLGCKYISILPPMFFYPLEMLPVRCYQTIPWSLICLPIQMTDAVCKTNGWCYSWNKVFSLGIWHIF